jgi:hypothetical protein
VGTVLICILWGSFFLFKERADQAPAATDRPGIARLKGTGHDVFAINPNMQTYEGEPCYPDLQSIPGGVDGVVITEAYRIERSLERLVKVYQEVTAGATSRTASGNLALPPH